MTRTEDQLSKLLHQAVPAAPAVRFDKVAQRARQRRHVQYGAAAAALAAAVVAVVVPLALAHGGGGPGRSTQSLGSLASGSGPITINSGGATFNPEPAPAGSETLSAQQAFADYNNGESIPAGVSYAYGALSVPLGPGTPGQYLYQNRPVWAYSTAAGCPIREQAPGVSPSPQTSPPGTCTAWTFLDPTTGNDVLSTSSDPQ